MRELLLATIPLLALTGSLWCAPGDAGTLMDAVRAGNLPAVQKTLQQRGNPNQAEPDGTTALHRAVQQDRLDIVQALIASGADLNVKNHFGVTPLAVALMNGSSAIAVRLLKAGANPQGPIPEVGTALLAAAHAGNPEVIDALLKAGVNVNEAERTTGQTALMMAAAEGHGPAVKALLAAGADPKVRSKAGQTALFFAVRRGDVGIVDALLSAGSDVNERAAAARGNRRNSSAAPGDPMLVVAILNAHFKLADFLLNKGADPNGAGSNWTALHAISRVRNYEEMQYPPPMVEANELDALELARRLIAHGADPNQRGLTTTVRRNPPDQNYADLIGATPFFLAAKSGDVPYMRLLLSVKADPSTPINDHTTPLMVAAGIGCVPGQWIEPERDVLAAVKLLVEELKADVNTVNDRKETAVHGAICRGADSVIQYLVDRGARLDVKDADGQTPADEVVQGLFRPTDINGAPIIIFHFPEHTVALVKKLTAAQLSAGSTSQTAQR